MADVSSNTKFNIFLQLTSSTTSSTVSPTITIKTYYGNGALVDQAINTPFTTTPLSVTSLTVLTNFNIPSKITT